MSTTSTRRRAALAGLLAAAAIGSAAGPAQAQADGEPRPAAAIDCQAGLERLESTFRVIEAHLGWELASRWWNEVAWPAFYRRCPNTI